MRFIRKNYKVIVGIIIGIVLTGSITYAATISSSDVEYSNTSSGLTSINVQGAIDEVYTKVNTWVNPNNMGIPTNYAFENKPTTSSPTIPPSGKNVYLGLYADGQYGVCIKRSEIQYCFRYHNYIAERKHEQLVFSGSRCFEAPLDSYVAFSCVASDFGCNIYSNGALNCVDYSTREVCSARDELFECGIF